MSHPRTGIRSAAAARHDVLGLLRGDHDRVLEEFREFERLDALDAEQACLRVAQRTFAELKVLAGVEEQLFYPAVHDAVAGTDLLDQSEIEHTRIHRLVDELEATSPNQLRYRKGFRTLAEYVRRHVQDEEEELYPMLTTASIDWDQLYGEMVARRSELAEDLGVAELPSLRHIDDAETHAAKIAVAAALADAHAEAAHAFEDEEYEPDLALEAHH